MTATSASSELRAAYNAGVRYIWPISEPTQSHLSGSAAQGKQDASSFCDSIANVYKAVNPLVVQSSNEVWTFLCLESATNMSSAYWTAWASFVGSYDLNGQGTVLYPSMYCNPGSAATNCSACGGYYCYALWSSEPEPCAACGTFGSVAYNADRCGTSYNVANAVIWQMAEQFTQRLDLKGMETHRQVAERAAQPKTAG